MGKNRLAPGRHLARQYFDDKAVLYPAGAHWKDAPASTFWNGLVVRIIPSLEKSLSEVH
jgi:hypothetical protein